MSRREKTENRSLPFLVPLFAVSQMERRIVKCKMLSISLKSLKYIIVIMLPLSVQCDNEITLNWYAGKWSSIYAPIKGEIQKLNIYDKGSGCFSRRFDDGKYFEYKAKSNETVLHEDIVILKFRDNKYQLAYKLVLSGWHTGGIHRIYGTMFMYRKGKQFNGLPVVFQKVQPNNTK